VVRNKGYKAQDIGLVV